MRRLFPRIGGAFSTITLLGASTILLAVAGETLWHASAVAGVRRAAPTAGEAAAASAEASANAATEMTMTDPLFKPFVYVELPLPEDYTLVEEAGVHLSSNGYAAATLNNGSSNLGFIWSDELYRWLGPIQYDASSDIVLADEGISGITVTSSEDVYLCGTCIDNSLDKAFFLEMTDMSDPDEPIGSRTLIGTGYAKDLNEQGVVVGTSIGGYPVAWWDILGTPQPLSGPGDLTNAVGVTPDTVPGQSYVVGQAEDAEEDVQAVLWYFDSPNWEIEELSDVSDPYYGAAVDVNDDGIVIGAIYNGSGLYDTVMWYDAGNWTWTQVSPALSPDFVPEAINNRDYPEIVGDKYLWISSGTAAGSGTQIDLTAYTLGMPSNMTNMRCTDINDAGTIVGVGQLGSGGDWVAFKIVPYDVNNNGDPDAWEIALTFEADENNNWLIDWAEDMRVGLHAPGLAEDPEGKLDPVQIVRMRVNIKPRAGNGPEGLPEDDYIDQIVNTASYCANCTAFAQKISDWGTGATRESPGTDQQSEIIVRVHSLMGENDSGWGDHEGLPDDDTDPDLRTEALEDIQSFAYRFAHCIDYLQWGNESFYGAGRYKFRDGELDCDSFADGTDFEGLPTNCKAPAAAAINTWQDQQMWAALVGSALAGRPLRMITTGFGAARINGTAPSTVAAQVIDGISDWANANQMYMALHVHYTTVQEAKDAIEKLTGTGSYTNPPWSVPDHRIATEVGTKADFPAPQHTGDTWWIAGDPTNGEVHNMFFWNTGTPTETWEAFIARWEDDSDSFGDEVQAYPGFRVGDVFGYFDAVDFQAICWTALQYDPGDEEHPSPFLVESLRGTEVRDEDFFGQYNETDRFSPLVDDYETAGGTYENDPFAPHDSPCSTGETCPGCGG